MVEYFSPLREWQHPLALYVSVSLNDCFNFPFFPLVFLPPCFFSRSVTLFFSDFTSEKFRESGEIFLSAFICLQSEQERACVEAISSSSVFRFTSVYATSQSPCLSLYSLPCMYPFHPHAFNFLLFLNRKISHHKLRELSFHKNWYDQSCSNIYIFWRSSSFLFFLSLR